MRLEYLFLAGFAISLLLVYSIRHIALRFGILIRPKADRWHSHPTPTLGGIGIYISVILTLSIYEFITPQSESIQWGVLLGGSIIFFLGLLDDLKPITPQAKLVGQILAASAAVFLGYTTYFFTPRIPDSLIAQVPNILLSFLWLVGITNAINLLDNMDGLAGGISLIAIAFLSFFFWKSGEYSLLPISLALGGSILAFLSFNYPPAKIFMGDSGSQFLGFTLAVLAIAHQPQASNVFAVMGVPTILLLLPILDTAFVMVTRLLRGQPVTQGGRDHTSHRLIAFGLNERQALAVFYAVAIISGIVAVVLESLDYDLSLVLVPLLIISLALFTAYLGRLKVVTSQTHEDPRPLTRLMLELTYRRRLLEIILDFFLISVVYYLAFWTLHGFSIAIQDLELYITSLPIVLIGCYFSFILFGVYRGVWRYIGVGDLLNYIKAVFGAIVIILFFLLLLSYLPKYSPVLFVLFAVYLFLALTATRSSFRILDVFSSQRNRPREELIIICGTGDSGEMAIRWILMNPDLGYKPVGFVDDDPMNIGRQIHGVRIIGGLQQLDSLLENKQIDGIVITKETNQSIDFVQKVVTLSKQKGCWVRTFRLEFELKE